MTMTQAEAELAMRLAIGRLLRLGSRPAQPGDAAQFHALRHVVFEAAEALGRPTDYGPHPHDYAAHHGRGAAGD